MIIYSVEHTISIILVFLESSQVEMISSIECIFLVAINDLNGAYFT